MIPQHDASLNPLSDPFSNNCPIVAETQLETLSMIDGRTQLIALFGRDISHSLSPSLHNQWLKENDKSACYLCLPSETKEHFLTLVSGLLCCPNFLGGNITVPYKADVLSLAGLQADKRVQMIGAANTLYRCRPQPIQTSAKQIQPSRETGPMASEWALTNTDVDGILATIAPWLSQNPGAQVVVLGAGGAAAAALYALAQESKMTDITVACRQPERAHPTCVRYASRCVQLDQLLEGVHETQDRPTLLINTLPLGHHGENNPAAQALITGSLARHPGAHFFFDMVYRDTPALVQATSVGVPAQNGTLMLRTQAAQSFKLWTNA